MDPKIEEMAQFLLDCAMLQFKLNGIMNRISHDEIIDILIKKLINARMKQSTINGGTKHAS